MKHVIFILILSFITGCAAASSRHESFREWKEEVKLNDGRIIMVNQKWRCDRIGKYNTGKEYCSTMRESWLTFQLPEFSNQEITWNEELMPLVLNVDQGQLYIVGIAEGGQFLIYGKPQPPYIGYRWNADEWHRIPFEEIPEAIYKTNMATEFPRGNSPSLFKLEAKDKSNNRTSLSKSYRRVNPSLRVD